MLYQTVHRLVWRSFEMGTLAAVLSRRGENAARAVVTMVEAMNSEGPEAYGMASPTTVKIAGSLETLKKTSMESSSSAVGYAFSRILPKDKPQPLGLKNAAMVFEGRLYPVHPSEPDAEITAKKLEQNPGQSVEQSAKVFVKRASGDFAFALAKPEMIVAGRDTMGVRPLYYGENANFAALASERKALWSVGILDARSFPPGCVSLVERSGFSFIVARRIRCFKPKEVSMEAAARTLRKLLEHSVRERISGLEEVAVAFSGGLDSSIIASLAKKTRSSVILVHVSLQNESEVEYAKQAAEELKLPLYCHLHAEHEVLQTVQRVIGAVEEPDPVKVSIGIPIYWSAQKTAEMNCAVMLAGQGADELFGGYKRYLDEYLKGGSDSVQNTMFNDIVGMYESNLERDSKICNGLSVELRLPFATSSIARFAIGLSLELKMERTESTLRKLVLRKVAKDLLLPQNIVERPKKAIQYTTGINKALKKMAAKEEVSMAAYLQKVFEKTFKKHALHA
jgi:asparagine synthase (glutamine-hydrolysing)